MRQAFGRLGGRTLIAWEGRVFLLAETRMPALPDAQARQRQVESYHCLRSRAYHCLRSATVVVPSHSKVVPLTPEFIAPYDGAQKQDCERNAVKRWFEKHRARLAPLRPVFWATICSPATPSPR